MSIECPHPDEFRIPSGDELRRARLLADLDRTEAAQAVGTTRQTLKRYEEGGSSPRLELVTALLDLYREEVGDARTDGGEVRIVTDPYGVVPDDFPRLFDNLAEAERQPSTTDRGDLTRCRYCKSTNITPKPGSAVAGECDHRKAGSWRCCNSDCGKHFSKPLPPANEVDEPEGAE